MVSVCSAYNFPADSLSDCQHLSNTLNDFELRVRTQSLDPNYTVDQIIPPCDRGRLKDREKEVITDCLALANNLVIHQASSSAGCSDDFTLHNPEF